MTRAPAITVDDSSKVYGDENPTFAVRFDGFVLGQGAGVLGGELEVRHRGHHVQCRRRLRRRGVRAGERQLRHQVHRGTLEVTRAPLSVTVVDSSKVYIDENPTFTVTYKGFVLGQGAGVLGGELEYEAHRSSAVGGYGVAASGLASGNYAIEATPGAPLR